MEMKIEGLDDLLDLLRVYPLEESEEKRMLRAGAKVVKEAVVEEVPVDDGTLKGNIKIKPPSNGEVIVHTGDAYHAHIIEGGRSAGSKFALKNGKRQKVTWGPIAPNPFFTRAFERSKGEALDAMVDELKKVKKL